VISEHKFLRCTRFGAIIAGTGHRTPLAPSKDAPMPSSGSARATRLRGAAAPPAISAGTIPVVSHADLMTTSLDYLTTASLVLGVICALAIVIHIASGRLQHMDVMNIVWPVMALYAGPLAL
jgi:hypothetical protein